MFEWFSMFSLESFLDIGGNFMGFSMPFLPSTPKNPRKEEEKEEEKEDHRISELRIALLSNLALASSRLKQYRPAVGGWTAVDWTDCAKSLGLSPSDILSDLF